MTRRRASRENPSKRAAGDPSGAGTAEQADAGAHASRPAPSLYIVATPIGNLADITLRALDTLRAADRIACEDTRVTRKLTNHFGIDAPLLAYNDHNARRVLPGLIERLKAGECVALVSDAGTPLISDPGYRLVRAALDEGVAVVPVPGPVAAAAALTVAGLPTDAFMFAGFLPPKAGARRRRLGELAAVPATLVFYEAPQRLAEALADMAAALGPRPAAIARELTKLHEEVRRGTLDALAAETAAEPAPRGELAIVVGPPEAREVDDAALEAMLARALDGLSVRDAVQQVAAESGRSRSDVYRLALTLGGDGEEG